MARERIVTQQTEVSDETYTPVVRDTSLAQTARIIYYIMGVINVLLLLRLILQAFAANPRSPFVAFIYNLTVPLLAPFRGIFDVAAAGGAVIDPAILVAMVVYALVAKGLVELLYLLARRRLVE